MDLQHVRQAYPRDLSAGQRQRVALASVLVGSPSLILLDEPTRGLDNALRDRLGLLLKKFIDEKGMTVILVTQDVEFAADHASRVVLFSEGSIIADGSPQEVLDDNLFYSTQINRIFCGMVDGVVNLTEARMVMNK